MRLDRAAGLLLTTRKSIKECWVLAGYNDGSNFTHDFVRRFGVPPRTYRERGIDRRPEISAACATEEPAGPPASTVLNRAVLIVDDDEGTRETEARWLRLTGFHVRVAATGAAALTEIDRGGLEAVLLDFHLPDMTGLECLRELRRRPGGTGVPVAIFTADWDVQDNEPEIRALGATIQWKLCDLEHIGRLVSYLAESDARPHTDM